MSDSWASLNVLPLQKPHLISIPSITLQIFSELDILRSNGILSNMREAENRQNSAENAQSAANIERILGTAHFIIATCCLNIGEDVRAYKGTNLPYGGSYGVVLSSDTGGAGLRGNESDIVTRTKFAQGEEDAVDDGKSGNVGGPREGPVETSHDEAHHALDTDAGSKCIPWASEIREERAEHSTWDIEDVQDDVPAECRGERGVFRKDVGKDGRGVDAEGVGRELCGNY